MNAKELARHISSRTFLPVYLLYGEEDYLVERYAKALASAALGDGDASFNEDVFRGTDHAAEDITAAANAFPFMSEKRVVLVRESDPLMKKPALASYVQNPSPDTVMILCAGAMKPSRAKKTAVKKGAAFNMLSWMQQQERGKEPHGAAVEFKPLRDPDALSWITAEFRRSGKRITPEAATVMQGLRGNNTRTLSSEVQKLVSALPEKEEIDTDDVFTHLGASKQYNLFALGDAVLARDGAKAHEILANLLGDTEPAAIAAMLSRQLSLIWRLRTMPVGSGVSDEQARELGLVWAWQANNLRKYIDNFPDPEYFERCFEYILETDLSIKSQSSDDAVAVTKLVSELTRA